MKKSHKWEEIPTLEVRCPHCRGVDRVKSLRVWVGYKIKCRYCLKKFELGRQK